jgi:hypothetical protein
LSALTISCARIDPTPVKACAIEALVQHNPYTQYWLSKATLDSGNAAETLTLIDGAFGALTERDTEVLEHVQGASI